MDEVPCIKGAWVLVEENQVLYGFGFTVILIDLCKTRRYARGGSEVE